jgi:predicted RNase H-like nuclease (RuvC/YqgF family)
MVKKTHVCDGCHERIQDVVASEATKIRELESDFQRSQDINRELRRIIEIRERDNDRLKFQVEQLRKIEAVANKIAAGWRGMGSAFESIDQWMGESAESVDKELCAALGVELNYG